MSVEIGTPPRRFKLIKNLGERKRTV